MILMVQYACVWITRRSLDMPLVLAREICFAFFENSAYKHRTCINVFSTRSFTCVLKHAAPTSAMHISSIRDVQINTNTALHF